MTKLNNKNKDKYNYIINTKDGTYKKEKVKTYKYCFKCGKSLSEGSTSAFCDFYCYQEYCRENAKELDACYREWSGKD